MHLTAHINSKHKAKAWKCEHSGQAFVSINTPDADGGVYAHDTGLMLAVPDMCMARAIAAAINEPHVAGYAAALDAETARLSGLEPIGASDQGEAA
ncbi:hypothetical protein [Tropicimonas sp. IMCC34011]|uniref:hypothetical protein n=1 Tax=Tropicimonas sp. IMCC34011 TaxID=2248759 RepID=UPI000E220216|nr:hypothetical protein [Tropicimonas sp. IMCC34011]